MVDKPEADGNVGMDWDQAVSAAKESLGNEQVSEEPSEAVETQEDETSPASVAEPESEEAADQAQDTEAAESEELLSEQDLANLRETSPEMAKMAENLEKWRAKLTQQSQAQSEERKLVEQYLPAIQEFQKDPAAVVRQLAQQHGVNLAEEATPVEDSPPLEQRVADALRESLGDELDVLADPLAKPLVDAITQVVDSIVEERIGPIQTSYQQRQQKEALGEVEQAEKKFSEAYPDWKQYEAAMTEQAKRLLYDAEGNIRPTVLTPYETLETLYKLATSGNEKLVAKEAEKLIERQNKAAKAADTAGAGVSPQHIRKKPPKEASFADAVRAAKAGERWASY